MWDRMIQAEIDYRRELMAPGGTSRSGRPVRRRGQGRLPFRSTTRRAR